jgi:hypothetical protein
VLRGDTAEALQQILSSLQTLQLPRLAAAVPGPSAAAAVSASATATIKKKR